MKSDLKTNAKQLSQSEQYQIRRNIVRLSKEGYRTAEIARILDVSERMTQLALKAYREQGTQGIKPKKRGRRSGEKRLLTQEQEREIQKAIVDKTPEQLKLKCCLWTRKAIHEFILGKYGIDLKLSTLGYYLERWGFSVQRPVKRARRQDPTKVDAWLNSEYPEIAAKAKAENAEIYWGDETALQNTANYARGYAPKGQTPVLEVESKKMKLNLLCAVSNRGKLRFTITKEPVNADILIDFMKRLVKDTGRKVLLILDNLRVHHSKKVAAWLGEHRDQIELFFLPPYSPEHNPDEYLNSDLKRNIGKKPMPRSEKELERNTRSFLLRTQLSHDHVRSYFGHQSVAYAA